MAMKRLFGGLLSLALALGSAPIAQAQPAYPEKPVKLIVPWPPGGSADAIGRLVAVGLAAELKTSVYVENVAGASGTIGTQQLVRSQPDGHTLLLATSSANAAAPHLLKRVGFAPVNDFRPIGLVAMAPSVLVVPLASPFKVPNDIVEAARRKPGQLSFGSGGNGNSGHLSGELFKSVAKIDATHVPYKGNTPAMTDLIGGQTDFMFAPGAIPFIKGGRVRALAVASDARLQALPDVPTFAELGLPGMKMNTWFGLAAPAATPAPVVQRISAALNAALGAEDMTRRLTDMGAQVQTSTPDKFAAFWRQELDRYKELIKLSGANLE